jgi:hypothetical protein
VFLLLKEKRHILTLAYYYPKLDLTTDGQDSSADSFGFCTTAEICTACEASTCQSTCMDSCKAGCKDGTCQTSCQTGCKSPLCMITIQ